MELGWGQVKKRGGVCQNVSRCMSGAWGVCLACWVHGWGVGHVKGAWDVFGVAAACRKHGDPSWEGMEAGLGLWGAV